MSVFAAWHNASTDKSRGGLTMSFPRESVMSITNSPPSANSISHLSLLKYGLQGLPSLSIADTSSPKADQVAQTLNQLNPYFSYLVNPFL